MHEAGNKGLTGWGDHLHDVSPASVCSHWQTSTNDLAELHQTGHLSGTCTHVQLTKLDYMQLLS